jgi:hypothetical protein
MRGRRMRGKAPVAFDDTGRINRITRWAGRKVVYVANSAARRYFRRHQPPECLTWKFPFVRCYFSLIPCCLIYWRNPCV